MKGFKMKRASLTVLLLAVLALSSICSTSMANNLISPVSQNSALGGASPYWPTQFEPIEPIEPIEPVQPVPRVPENWYSNNFDFIRYLSDNPNDYQKIWEPWLSRAAVHAIAASEDGEFLAVGGGYLYDNEVHIFRWNIKTLEYDRVWDSGDGIIKRDILSLAWGDTDNNNFMEVVVGSADGHVYVFEQRHIYDPFTNTENQFEHVWTSPQMRPVFSVKIGDTDRDGVPDILVGAWDGIHIFEYKSHSGYPFSREHTIEYEKVWRSNGIADPMVCSITHGDVNSNGLPDIIAGTRNGTIYIFENNGTVINVNGKPFPLLNDNNYRLCAVLEGYIWNPITCLDAGNLDNDIDDEIMAMALGQGVYVINRKGANDFTIEKLVRPLESWETTASPHSLDYFVDAAISASLVYYEDQTEPMANPPSPIAPWNTAMARIDMYVSKFLPMFVWDPNQGTYVLMKATALLDFGRDEEVTGNGNNLPDVEVVFRSLSGFASEPNFANLKFYISQDGTFFTEVSEEDLTWSTVLLGFSVQINLDSILYRNRWDYVRYLNITVQGFQRYAVDGVQAYTLYRPVDTATFAGIFQVKFNSSDLVSEFKVRLQAYTYGEKYSETAEEEPNKILIGTADGRLIVFAYNTASKSYCELWDSYLGKAPIGSRQNMFNLKTNIWAIQDVKTAGKIPTWLATENFMPIEGLPLFCNVEISGYEYASMTLTDVYPYDFLPDLIVGTKGDEERPGTIECISNTATNAKLTHVNYWYMLPWNANNTKLWLSTTFGDINLTRPTYLNYNPLELIVGYFEPGTMAGLDYWEVVGSTGYWYKRVSLTELDVTGELRTILDRSTTLPKAALADMDGDRDLDLTITNGRSYYLENVGNLSNPLFAVRNEYYHEINTRGSDFSGPQLVDFDMDGDFDLVVSFASKYGATYFENTGTGKNPVWVEKKKFFSNPERNFKLCNFTDPIFYRASQLYYLIGNTSFSLGAFCQAYYETFGTTWVMSAYNNETRQIATFFGDVNSHNRLIVGTNPKMIRLEVALADGLLWNLGYHVFETWNNEDDLDEWTLTVKTGDVDNDGKNEVIVGDFDNNLYVFEHLTNNTYKRAFRSFDFNHTVESDESPYAWQELAGLSGNFSRKIWDHVENLVADSDLDKDGLKEIIATADLSIYVFEQKVSAAGIPISDEFNFIWSIDLRKSKWSQSLQEKGLERISALSYCSDIDYNGFGEIIVAVGSYLFIYESGPNNTFKEVFFYDAPLGRYLLPGNPEVSLGSTEYAELFINAVTTGDTDSDGFQEIIVGGTRTLTETGSAQHGFVFILENHIGTYQLSWEAPQELTYLNPVNAITVDDQDYDGRKELIIGHEHGIDIWEWSGADNSYVKMEAITSSPNYPAIYPTSVFFGEAYYPGVGGRNSDILQLGNGTLLQVYSNLTGYDGQLRIWFVTSNDEGQNWSVGKRLNVDTEYGSATVYRELEPSVTEFAGRIWFAWRVDGFYLGYARSWICARYYSSGGWSPIYHIVDTARLIPLYSPTIFPYPTRWEPQAVGIFSIRGKPSNPAHSEYEGRVLFVEIDPASGSIFWYGEILQIGLDPRYPYEASYIDAATLNDGSLIIVFSGKFKEEFKKDYDIWAIVWNVTSGWSKPVRLTSKSTDERNPSVIQMKSQEGAIVVVFDSYGGVREESIQICYSRDGGRTWRSPEPLPSLPQYVRERIVEGRTYYEIIYGDIPVYTPQSFAPRITARNDGGFIYSVLTYTRTRVLEFGDVFDIIVGVNPSSKWALNDMGGVHVIDVGDTDSDGRREIAADYQNRVVLFELSHANSFHQVHSQVWTSPELPEAVTDVCIGDANGNGWEEIIISAERGNVYSYEIAQTSLPKVSLQTSEIAHWIFPYSESPIIYEGLKTGNFDHDLTPELVAARGENVTVFEADGLVLWTYQVVDCTIKSIGVGDINGDGVDDVIFGASVPLYGKVFALNGVDGTPLWNLTCVIAMPPRSVTLGDIAVGDLNGDGVKDIVIETSVFYYMGSPPRLVETPGVCAINGLGIGLLWSKTFSESIVGLAVGNLHVETYMDVVVTTTNSTQAFKGADGNKLWAFTPPNKSYNTPLSTPALCDINQNGLDDVVVSGTVYVYPSHKGVIFALNGLDGTQIWNSTLLKGSYKLYAETTIIVDLNGDDRADIVSSFNDFYMQNSHILGVDSSNGEALWTYSVKEDRVSFLTTGDFNNDGASEVVSAHLDLTSNNETLVVLDSKGMTIWGFHRDWITSFSGITTEDFDKNGAFEIALATNGQVYIIQEAPFERSPPSSLVRALETAWSRTAHETDVASMASGDFNGDGIDDIVSADYYGNICAFSGETGEKLWNASVPSTPLFLATGRVKSSESFDVVVCRIDKNGYGKVVALDGANGSQLWEATLPRRYSYQPYPPPGYYLWEYLFPKSLEFGNLDADAESEIIVAGIGILIGEPPGFVFAVDNNGSLLWYRYLNLPVLMIEIADVVGVEGLGFDGITDIIALTFNSNTGKNYVDVINGADASIVAHVQITQFFTSIIASETGFLNSDAYPDIAALVPGITSDEYSYCFAIDLYASIMDGTYARLLWSAVVPYAKSIAVSNLDSYAGDEVAVLAWMSEIVVLNGANGGVSWRFTNPTVYPIPFSPHAELSQYKEHAPPLVGDVNGDGTKEIILLNWAKVYAVSRKRMMFFYYKTIVPWATRDFSSGITAYTMGNFDGDAYPDIAVGALDGNIFTLFDLVEAVKYQLQISTTAGGTTSPAPGTYTYAENTQVAITAFPESGYQFDRWLINGTITSTENPITILMDANYAITAYFTTVQTHTLTIQTTTGGTTSPSPGTYVYPHGEKVSVRAVPDSGYMFDRWVLSNDTTSTRNPITLTMDADYTIAAYFRNATGVIPHDNLYINEDTVLARGFYNLEDDYEPEGIIIINASNIVLDCNFAVLNGNGWGYAIVNNGFHNVTIKNAIIQNFEWSVYIESGENNVITYNELAEASICLFLANNTQIMYNHLFTSCIELWMSHLSIVMNNTLEDCYIKVERSNNCTVMYNNISLGRIIISGSSVYSANYNIVARNNITGGPGNGIELFTADHNVIAENYVANKGQSGIYLTDSDFNIVVGNVVNSNGESGIRIRSRWWSSLGFWVDAPCYNNTIAKNIANFNVEGIYMNGETKYSTIVNNTLTQNNYGIFLKEEGGYHPTYNTIYHNNFIDNTFLQARDDGANIFDGGYPSGGNYWSNYTGTDANHDGIGDTPYIIDTNSQDNYPSMNPNSWQPYTSSKITENPHYSTNRTTF